MCVSVYRYGIKEILKAMIDTQNQNHYHIWFANKILRHRIIYGCRSYFR